MKIMYKKIQQEVVKTYSIPNLQQEDFCCGKLWELSEECFKNSKFIHGGYWLRIDDNNGIEIKLENLRNPILPKKIYLKFCPFCGTEINVWKEE